ncbi:Ger(x)C family spore germination protein [Paenibacillus sp. GCM10023248]|uniref:Ger(x)C family spore germination protein n=1 Tax=Bacillales TaxID=1385 RepID=UPI002378956A|nr:MULTISPECIES: Ger(x)C family spore germination protein [Bacillales]MDD9268332.1 Ger(x)C family spore germination protein [Paenibacillus sp. MAHUQ-63]MDR6880013.1 spore germination protein KC [Bacillus sp. 3255]
MKPLKYVLLISLFLVSGCWDRTEINDLAFVMGTALDLTDDGKILCSLQIAIPSTSEAGKSGGGEGKKKNYFIIDAAGKSGNEIHRMLQKKSTRRLFLSHRSFVFISERLAGYGIQDALDIFTHDPRNRLKTYLVVVKGGEARNILQMNYPLKQVPIEAVKEIEISGDDITATLRDFYISFLSEGIHPVVGAIELENDAQDPDKQIFRFAGAAAFKHLKLSGIFDDKETIGLMWVTDKLRFSRITANLPKGSGEVGMILNHARSKISMQTVNDAVQFQIQLDGMGSLAENNSSLSINDPKDFEVIQQALEAEAKKIVQDFLYKIQKKYKVDCVGFGQEIYKNDPDRWTAMKDQWDTLFPGTEISVNVNLTIQGSGMVHSTFELHKKEDE